MNHLDAGDFITWLNQLGRAGGADVPCGDCNACCRASYFIHVTPQDADARAHLPPELLFPAPGREAGHQVMGFDQTGSCPMLANGSCRIYPHRPQTCRDYDCRIFAATGIAAGGSDKQAVNARVAQWRFRHASIDSERRLARLREIAAGLDPQDNPTQRALQAIRMLNQEQRG